MNPIKCPVCGKQSLFLIKSAHVQHQLLINFNETEVHTVQMSIDEENINAEWIECHGCWVSSKEDDDVTDFSQEMADLYEEIKGKMQ